jgi:PAS domain S-box-containing protein
MKRFFSSLSFRIWFPFAISLSIGIIFLGFYYPKKQSELYREIADKNLTEISKILALSTSISIEFQNFEALSNSINLAKSIQDFEFVALVQKDSITSKERIFASNPININEEIIFNIDSSKYFFKKYPVKTNLIDGHIVVAASRDKLEQRIHDLNQPVYFALGLVLLFSLFAFMLFAKHLSNPIIYLTNVANQLTLGNLNSVIEKKSMATEISDLNFALSQLRIALLDAKEKNDHFNKQLEEKIKLRTIDLENTKLRLLEAQEVAELGNFEFDLDSGNWNASQKVHEIFEIPENFAFTDNSWKMFFEHDVLAVLMELFKNSSTELKSFQQDFPIKIEDHLHHERWISISGKAITNSEASSIVIRGTIQDITKRKLIDKEIRKLSLVAQKTSNCVIITDTNYIINWVNESTLKLTGYTREELIGKTPSIFQFEKTNLETKRLIRNKLNELQEVKTTILNKSKSGAEYWLDLNIVPLFNEEEKHIGFMAVEVDITERIKFEQSIRESEENYLNILENSSELIHTADNNGNLIWANRSWREKLAIDDINIEGLNLDSFLDKESLYKFKEIYPKILSGEIITDFECVFISNKGSFLNLQGRIIPYYKDSKIIGSQAYLHDITLIKKAEFDLKNLLKLTQDQNKRLRNFTHIVSHNLRSHSSNIDGLISLLSIESPNFNENIYFSNLEIASNNLMNVIQNLSEVANIQTDDQKKYVTIDIQHTIKKVISSIYGIARNAGVTIHFDSINTINVIGDLAYIESILLNLLTNGIKYKSNKRDPYIQIVINQEDDTVCVNVIDNGLGIDLERHKGKIFGMYKTFHKHPDARGVGLFLAKNQAEAMGGKIEVESNVDVGSTFKLFLRSKH